VEARTRRFVWSGGWRDSKEQAHGPPACWLAFARRPRPQLALKWASTNHTTRSSLITDCSCPLTQTLASPSTTRSSLLLSRLVSLPSSTMDYLLPLNTFTVFVSGFAVVAGTAVRHYTQHKKITSSS
jgi:hypothetical protein